MGVKKARIGSRIACSQNRRPFEVESHRTSNTGTRPVYILEEAKYYNESKTVSLLLDR